MNLLWSAHSPSRFEQALAYRLTVRGQTWMSSAVYRPRIADDWQPRTGPAVTDPRGLQEFGRFLERLLGRGRRLRRRRQ
jgi:hypothetical protein